MSTTQPHVTVIAGNPKPQSRTLAAAEFLARELSGQDADLVVDLAELAASLFDHEDARVIRLIEQVRSSGLVVFASPTYKASITGLLKVFLDRLPSGGLTGVAVPLMLGAGPTHALAPEYALRPVLVALGATVPVRGLYVYEDHYADPSTYETWLADARPIIDATRRGRADTTGALI